MIRIGHVCAFSCANRPDQGLVAVERRQMHADGRHLDARRAEEPLQGGGIGQSTGIEDPGEFLRKLAFAAAVIPVLELIEAAMTEELNRSHRLALQCSGTPCRKLGARGNRTPDF
ncbi:hypothetical protein CHELA1G11_10125 [Hyphomicrobiales bacterium]|nr:hypothetical protein CHELA1G11_10125 [Hyphomicrobiales bacterium]CAH1676891.1 hypothetical protein CHELA1G2_14184 [Hyphomicrobiales bacterium]